MRTRGTEWFGTVAEWRLDSLEGKIFKERRFWGAKDKDWTRRAGNFTRLAWLLHLQFPREEMNTVDGVINNWNTWLICPGPWGQPCDKTATCRDSISYGYQSQSRLFHVLIQSGKSSSRLDPSTWTLPPAEETC